MDPVTITGLIVSVSQLIEYTGKILSYVNSITKAPAERNEITKECVIILARLSSLTSRADKANPNDVWFARLRDLARPGGPLEEIRKSLEKIAKTLKPAKGAKKYIKMILWPSSKNEMQDVLSRIHQLHAIVSEELHEDHFNLALDTNQKAGDTRDYQQDLKRQKVLDWISTMTFTSKQQDHLSRHQPGTGNWFLNEPLFQKWVLGDLAVLWCPGYPAVGKTILTSVIIDHLETRTEHEDAEVLYLYCNYKEQHDQTAMNLVRSLVRQIVQRQSVIPAEVSNLYDHFVRTQKSPLIGEWTELLLSQAVRLNDIFIVIDAFDECSEATRARHDLLHELCRIVENPRVKLLITTRPMAQVNIGQNRRKTLEIRARREDMRLYIEDRVNREKRLSKNIQEHPDLREHIVSTVLSKAKGMFLVAKLHLDSLSSKNTLAKVRKFLESIPEDLDEVYDQAMFRIKQQNNDDVELAQSVLAWVASAQRPLKIIELRQALAVEPEKNTIDPEAMPDATTLVDICAGMVTIDESSGVIRLVHLTTQDYFVRKRAAHFPSAHRNVAMSCLAYLSISEFHKGCSPSEDLLSHRLGENQFLAYAATYWAKHLCDAEKVESVDDPLQTKALGLLNNTSLFGTAYQTELKEKKEFFISQDPNPSAPLHFAIAHDLTWIAHELIRKVPDINALDPHGRSALEIAVHQENQSVILGLLQAGAIVDRKSPLCRSILYNATCGRSTTMAQKVLQAVRDPDLKAALWHTAVKEAFKVKNLKSIKDLMCLIDANLKVKRLLHDFLSALVKRNLPQQRFVRLILESMPQSACICRAGTSEFDPFLFGWETTSSNIHVLLARMTESHVVFSMRLTESLNKAFMDELAESCFLVLPEDGDASGRVGLAFRTEPLDCESRTDKEMTLPKSVKYHSLLETAPFSSMLAEQFQPYTLLYRLPEYQGEVWLTAFSHDGRKLAITGERGGVLIYDTSTYTSPQSLGGASDGTDNSQLPDDFVNNILSWSPDDSKILSIGRDGKPHVWDVQSTTGTVLTGYDSVPTSGQWDPRKASTPILGSRGGKYGLTSFTKSGTVRDRWGKSHQITGLRTSNDGQILVTITAFGLHKYRMETKERIGELLVDGAGFLSVDITRDSRHILLLNIGKCPGLLIVESETYEVVRTFDGPVQRQFITHAIFGGLNDEYVLCGSEDGLVYVWNREAQLLAILQHSPGKCVNDVSWNPQDPTIFASGCDDGTLCIWKKCI